MRNADLRYKKRQVAALLFFLTISVVGVADSHDLYIGWAQEDITPSLPVALTGQQYKRISTHVQDPLTATALAIETVGSEGQKEQAILVSCDLIWIRKDIQDRVRQAVAPVLSDFDVNKLILNATHTHTGPGFKDGDFYGLYDVSNDPGVMTATEYGDFLVGRLASMAQLAWNNRALGGISWTRGQSITGHNRRITYFDGSSDIYKRTDNKQFSHPEGYESHDLDVLFLFDGADVLTGILINTPTPSQALEFETYVSADFWHDVRQELRTRYGTAIYIFPQCGAGGDQSPHTLIEQEAESRMIQLRGLTLRKEIARRIANTVDDVYPIAQLTISHQVEFEHSIAFMNLAVKNPPSQPFYKTDDPPVEVHCMQIGEIAIATVPFELYLDYGMRIKARSLAAQTLISQLSCQHAGYLPTTRAAAAGGYSADKYIVGPTGGQQLVDGIVDIINAMITDTAVQMVAVAESNGFTLVNEMAQTWDTYEIRLLSQPTGDVLIMTAYDPSHLHLEPGSLLFTAENWMTPQTITVTALDDGIVEGTHTAVITHAASGGGFDDADIDSVLVTIEEDQMVNLVVNGDFELPRVKALPPYWQGWPDNWTLSSGKVVIDNEPTKWNQDPYNSSLGNQYLVGLPSGVFYQDIAVPFEANKSYLLSVDLGTLLGRPSVDYTIQLRDVQTDTIWAQVDQTDFGYPSPGYWDVTALLSYTTPSMGLPVGNQIRIVIEFKEAVGTYKNGICADNVILYAEDSGFETEQVQITESNSQTLVNEYGSVSDTYEIQLLVEPTEDVALSLTYDTGQLTVTPSTLQFTTANWDQPQTVTVTAVSDGEGEGTHTSLISHSAAGGNYEGIPIPNILVTIEEGYPTPPSVQLTESDGTTLVTEFGQTADSYEIQLLVEPTDPVAIAILYDSAQLVVDPAVVQFTPADWAQAQSITVTAVRDGAGEGTHASVISHTAAGGNYTGIAIENVTVSIEEGYPPPPSVQLIESDGSTRVNEFGPLTDTYGVNLLAEPNEPVTISLVYDSNQISVNPSALLFDSTNWEQPQTVTITAIADGSGEGIHSTVISHAAAGGNYEGVPVDSLVVTIDENLISNGDFEQPRVTELPPYWWGWPYNWVPLSGDVVIDNEPAKWRQAPYNETLGNQYLVGLPSGSFAQNLTAAFEADKTYHLSVDLGTLLGRTNVNYSIELRDVQTNTVWAHADQTDFGYPTPGYWNVTAELTYTTPSAGEPIGNNIRVFIRFEEGSGTYKNGICADNVALYVTEAL